jgi:uncharacterized metal-binding protein
MGEAFAGMKVDSRFDHVETGQAQGAIPFGYPVGAEAGNTTQVSVMTKDIATLLYDADFVSLNVINGTVNGVAWAPVTFDTDQATTLAALIAAIDAMTGVSAVAGAARTVVIEMDDSSTITVTTVVTLGASQATGTPTYSADNVFRGIALHENVVPVAGVAQYVNTASVSVLRQGAAWVECSVAVTADEDAYVDIAAATAKFTNVSSGNIATGGKFRSTLAAAGIAKLEINLP